MSDTPRFHLSSIPPDGLVSLEGPEARHAVRVLRLGAGDALCVFDGAGREALCRVTEAARGRILARVESEHEARHPEPAVRLCFYPSLSKGERFSWTLQKLCELGAAEITPVLSRRCVVRDWTEQKALRHRRILTEAARQSGRGHLPVLHGLTPLETLLPRLRDGITLFCHETAPIGLKQTLDASGAFRAAHVFTGPEGGYAPEEAARALECGARPVRMGNAVLRCETAPLTAAAALLYAAGQL
ncbi:MAG: 16S rRNA (uracil(1498)-N(3))-methyltransferase [Oscillospiraceae bacterium]|nr:16S rRNA (uracil(1498)-N(3))-methyltransferase [Oscillospiraceae bacterium]